MGGVRDYPAGPRVMVVDDEPDLVELVRDILALEGFLSVGVSRPDTALSAAQQSQPELFLLDVNMGAASGIEVARQLRTNGFPYARMIAMSGFETMVHAARDSGLFDACLRKPFDVEELCHTVKETLRQTAAV